MALDPDVEAEVLDWVGAAAAGDEDFETAVSRTGSARAAALSILRRRRALAGPDEWAVAGDYSESNRSAVAWLDERIARLEGLLGDDTRPAVTTGRMFRCGATR